MGEAAEAIQANYDPMNEQDVREAFLQAIATEATRADALTQAYGRAPESVHDDATASQMTDLAKQLGACAKAIEAKRKEHKGRYDTCGAVIHTAATGYTNNLAKLKKQCESRLTDYQCRIAEAERKRREDGARKAAEEAAKRAAEMETESDLAAAEQAEAAATRAQKEAAASAADLHKARGEYGSVASLRSVLAFEITQFGTVPLDALRPYLGRDVIEKAVRAYMRDHAEDIKTAIKGGDGYGILTGVRFFEDQQTRVR